MTQVREPKQFGAISAAIQQKKKKKKREMKTGKKDMIGKAVRQL